MEQAAIILLKTNVAIIIFAAFYWLVLKKLTFYNLNRFFFLFAVTFSLVFPFVEIGILQIPKLAVIPELMPSIIAPISENTYGKWFQLLSSLWLTGTIILFGKLLLQLKSLYAVHKKSYSEFKNNSIRFTSESISPFSFGNKVYINPELHTNDELKTILTHELIHVKHKHTIDILLTELVLIINWFNPFIWLLRKSIKENLEFITDNEVLKKGVEKKNYQYQLLKVSTKIPVDGLQNAFSIADLKKRILQMNKEKTSQYKVFVYASIPLLALLLLCFNQPLQTAANELVQVVQPLLISKKEPVENKADAPVIINEPKQPETSGRLKPSVRVSNLEEEKINLVLDSKSFNDQAELLPPPPEEAPIVQVVTGKYIGTTIDPVTNEVIVTGRPKVTKDVIQTSNNKSEFVVVGYKIE